MDKYEEIAYQLPIGLRKVELMKESVTEVVRLILRFVQLPQKYLKIQGRNETRELFSRTAQSEWQLQLHHNGKGECELCVVYLSGGMSHKPIDKSHPLSTEEVLRAYEKLPILIQKSFEFDPQLEQKLQPFLNASKVNITLL